MPNYIGPALAPFCNVQSQHTVAGDLLCAAHSLCSTLHSGAPCLLMMSVRALRRDMMAQGRLRRCIDTGLRVYVCSNIALDGLCLPLPALMGLAGSRLESH